jgi:hypothetical protein
MRIMATEAIQPHRVSHYSGYLDAEESSPLVEIGVTCIWLPAPLHSASMQLRSQWDLSWNVNAQARKDSSKASRPPE